MIFLGVVCFYVQELNSVAPADIDEGYWDL